MKTSRGIELDLNKSEFTYICNGFKLYFSSKLYLEKYASQINDFIDMETRKLEVKYRTKLNITPLLVVALYKKIEKRGFKVVNIIRDKELSETEQFIIYYKD